MTLETLEAYGSIISNLKAIRAERQALKGFEEIQSGGIVSEMLNNLDGAELDQKEALKEIESWITELDNPEIESIVRWHYIIGYSWKDTTKEVFGYADAYLSRKKIFRYFGRE